MIIIKSLDLSFSSVFYFSKKYLIMFGKVVDQGPHTVVMEFVWSPLKIIIKKCLLEECVDLASLMFQVIIAYPVVSTVAINDTNI